MSVHGVIDNAFRFQFPEFGKKPFHIAGIMVPEYDAFRQFEDAVSAVNLFPCGVTLPVAGIAVQKKVVDVEQTAGFEDPVDLIQKCALVLIGDNTGQDGTEQDRIE